MRGLWVSHRRLWSTGRIIQWAILVLLMAVVAGNAVSGEPSGKEKAVDSASANSSGVTLMRSGNAQFEIIGPRGDRVLTDVAGPLSLSQPPVAKDILVTTHLHMDHFNREFADTFPGQQLHIREGQIRRPELLVQGIASNHTGQTGDEFLPSGGSNYIYLIEMGGLRIAHFGDIGQKRLTPEQLTLLGRIDIAITQVHNSFSWMDQANQKGFRLMEQLKPRIIIPHHGGGQAAAIEQALKRWEVRFLPSDRLTLSRRDLPEQTTVLLMDERDHLRKTLNLKTWP